MCLKGKKEKEWKKHATSTKKTKFNEKIYKRKEEKEKRKKEKKKNTQIKHFFLSFFLQAN